MEFEYEEKGWDFSDALQIGDDIITKFMGEQPAGKIRVTGADGLPCWIDTPPATAEQLILIVKSQKEALITEATEVIAPMHDAKEGGYIDDEDIPRLVVWQKYRYDLTKVDLSTAPDINWPVAPQS